MYPSEKDIAAYGEKYKAIAHRNNYKKPYIYNERHSSNLRKRYKSIICRIGISLEKLGLAMQGDGALSYKS